MVVELLNLEKERWCLSFLRLPNKYHRLSGEKNSNLSPQTASGGWKSKMKVSAGFVSFGVLFPWLVDGPLLSCLHMIFSLCVS